MLTDDPYRSDAFSKLHSENEKLKAQLKDAKRPVINKTVYRVAWEDVAGIATVIVVLCIVAGLGMLAYKGISAPHKIDSCYIKYFDNRKDPQPYRLYGNIEWSDDDVLSDSPTFEEAVNKAKLIGCPIKAGHE